MIDPFEKVINVAPMVSVIIPVFNMEPMIRTTLNDIMHQNNFDPEIIVVDDGSTDGSPGMIASILRNYHGPCSLLTLGKNQGASNARNTGFDFSRGKYVFFIDGDDRMSEETLGKLLGLAESHGADVAFSGFRVCGPDLQGGKAYSWKGSKDGFCDPGEVLRKYLMGKRFINASNTLYRRSFLDSYGIRFPRGCRFAEDREFIVKALFHAKRAAFTSEFLVNYIQHPKQTTNRPGTGVNKYAHSVGVYLRLKKYLQEKGADNIILKEIETFEIPNAILKMATDIAKMGKLDLYNIVVHNRSLRSAVKPGLGSFFLKPEIALKTFCMLNIPDALFRVYKMRDISMNGD